MYEISAEIECNDFLMSIGVCAKELNEFGMVCDFYELKNQGMNALTNLSSIKDANILAAQLQKALKPVLTKDNHWLEYVKVKRINLMNG